MQRVAALEQHQRAGLHRLDDDTLAVVAAQDARHLVVALVVGGAEPRHVLEVAARTLDCTASDTTKSVWS